LEGEGSVMQRSSREEEGREEEVEGGKMRAGGKKM
jgi:hypothetical protein